MINKVLHGDCLDIMPKIPDKSIDLVLTSPPYNLGDNHHTNKKKHYPYKDNMPEKDYQNFQISVLQEIYRVLKPTGSLLYNHKNRIKKGQQITPYEWLLKTNFVIKQELVWVNGSPNFDKIRFYPFTERIYWLAKDTKTKLKNVISHTDFFTSSEWPSVGTKKEHTRAFPIQLAENLISCFPEANIILDPFGGSGTTAIACINTGRNYIIIEKEQKYYNLILGRIKKAKNE